MYKKVLHNIKKMKKCGGGGGGGAIFESLQILTHGICSNNWFPVPNCHASKLM